jgi:hypothetical protein
MARREGGKVATETRCSRRKSASACGDRSGSPLGTTSSAPATSAVKISLTEASKVVGANWRTREPTPIPNPSICVWHRLTSPACSASTPFGRPVEPDVKIT